ncbi:TIGR03086 family metal-binding protein [Kitasatospora sp. RB6PN24]|uniref:TIGR03086 family metal-binding protein n=1 Tax=Kitasatospora humi TaxID=2893891 RepID=UPI001E2C50E5|nr:TIGR03086 family metal-binding protein [Kitasatospora humi]MCC9308414.1 TIGR03086 family metal-binding protein [Kitasatospora humi]
MDPRPLHIRTFDQLETVFAKVTPADLDRPTPCTEFDLRELLGHVIGGIHRIAYIGEGGRALDIAPAVDRVDDTDLSGALGRARARALAAWADDAKLDRVVEVPWGEMPGRMALGGYVMEAVTHTWDIAQTIGLDTALDEELALISLDVAQKALPADRSREGLPFGPLQDVPADANAYARLAGWLGRTA